MSLTCCMTRQVSDLNAVAEEETEVLLIPVEMLDSWISRYPLWKQFVMQTYQNRFRELIDALDAVAFMNWTNAWKNFSSTGTKNQAQQRSQAPTKPLLYNSTHRARSFPAYLKNSKKTGK